MTTFAADLEAVIGRFDRVGAVEAALGALDDGTVTVGDLYDLLGDLLVATGAGWQTGTVEVWQEHLVSGIVRSVVEACAQRVERLAPPERSATVLLAAPDDEYHDLGLRMLTDRFTLAGWRAHFLGAALPVHQAIDAVTELGADAVALSTSTHFHRVGLRGYVTTLTAAHPDLRVWVGGPAFAHHHDEWPPGAVLDPRAVPTPREAGC